MKLLYFPQPLKRQSRSARSPFSAHTNVGQKSRVQLRSVGTLQNSTASRLAPHLFRMRRAFCSVARSGTRMRTFSTRDRCRITSPYTHGIGANFPGQSVFSCGQASQVASWRAHSPGMRNPSEAGVSLWSILREPAFGNGRVSVYAAISQERPMSANFVHLFRIALRNEHLFFLGRGLHDYASERVTDE